jgi:hypothetical protein
VVSPGWAAVSRLTGAAAGRAMPPVRADWMAAILSWARAVRTVRLLTAFQVRALDWSQPKASFPVRNVVSTGQRLPAMVMKYVMVAGRPSGAWHR